MVKRIFFPITLTGSLLLFVFLPGFVFAQMGSELPPESKQDTVLTPKNPGDPLVLHPDVDPYVYYDSYREGYRMQNGVFLGASHFGVETTLFARQGNRFGSFFLGGISSGGLSSENYWVGGVSLGRSFTLHQNLNQYREPKTEIYFRIGPGIGLAGKGFIEGSDSEYYFGLHTTSLFGAQMRISDHSSVFLNGGGRFLWFPGLNKIGFMGTPIISIGIQFSLLPAIQMERF